MYIESSYPQKENDKARLISPEYIASPSGSCVQFFYHMWGVNTGSLNVYLQNGEHIQDTPLWSLKGDQGNFWRPGRATIKASNRFQVYIKRKN